MTDACEAQWTTARHEAGHAVAAMHYGCPLGQVSIKPDGITLGTTQIAVEELEDAIVVCCGPLAEKAPEEFRPGVNVIVDAVGGDLDGLNFLTNKFGDLSECVVEARALPEQT